MSTNILKDCSEIYANFFNSKYPFTSKNLPQIFFPLISIMAADCNYNLTELYIQNGNLYISGYDIHINKSNRLMLRFSSKKLIVAQIEFINIRTGNMTELVEYLKYIKNNYNYECIEIECCNTKNIIEWCIKNGLTEYKDTKCYYDVLPI